MTALEKLFLENAPDSEVVLQKVIELGNDFLGGEWSNIDKNHVKVTKITGGQSNHMFHVTSSTSATPYLLRIHRQLPEHVFRDTVNFAIFSERGLGPKLFGFFQGGRLEEYLPSKTLDLDDVLKPEISVKVGAAFPKYHAIQVPASKSRRCIQLMRDWLQGYKDLGGQDYEILPTTIDYSDHPQKVSIEDLEKEIDTFEKWSSEIYEHTLVFSHNDLAGANILELNSTKELVFIDWEFGTYNWRGFDLAMHLAETAIDFRVPFPPGIKLIKDLNENPPNLRVFCEAYLDSDNKLKNHVPTNRCSELESLIHECQFFWPLTHLFWALSAMKHALLKFENGVDLDVQARDRLAVYYHFKSRSQTIYEGIVSKK